MSAQLPLYDSVPQDGHEQWAMGTEKLAIRCREMRLQGELSTIQFKRITGPRGTVQTVARKPCGEIDIQSCSHIHALASTAYQVAELGGRCNDANPNCAPVKFARL